MKKVLIIAQDDLSKECAENLVSNNFDISSDIKDIDDYELIISLKEGSLSNDDNVQFIIGLNENKDVFEIEKLFAKNNIPMSQSNIIFHKANGRIINMKSNIKPSGNSIYQELRNDKNVIVICINRFGKPYIEEIAYCLDKFCEENYESEEPAVEAIEIKEENVEGHKKHKGFLGILD